VADNVVNIEDVTLLEDEVFGILDEAVEFEDNSGSPKSIERTSGKKSLVQCFSNFHEPWPPSRFNWPILNIS